MNNLQLSQMFISWIHLKLVFKGFMTSLNRDTASKKKHLPALERWNLGMPLQSVEIRAKVAPASLCLPAPVHATHFLLKATIVVIFLSSNIIFCMQNPALFDYLSTENQQKPNPGRLNVDRLAGLLTLLSSSCQTPYVCPPVWQRQVNYWESARTEGSMCFSRG